MLDQPFSTDPQPLPWAPQAADPFERSSLAGLDRLVRLAATTLHAPIVLISTIRGQQQSIESGIGLPEPWNSLTLLPQSHSICCLTIAAGTPTVVEDTHEHALFADHAGIRDFNIRSYVGTAIQTADRQLFGCFCVADLVPREWSGDQLALLQDLSELAAAQFQLHHRSRQIKHLHMVLCDYEQQSRIIDEGQSRSELLNTLTLGMPAELTVAQVIERSIAQLSAYFPAYQIVYAVVDEQQYLKAAHLAPPLKRPDLGSFTFDLTLIPEYLALFSRYEPICIDDPLHDRWLAPLRDDLRRAGVGSIIGVPIRVGSQFLHPAKQPLAVVCMYARSAQAWSAHERVTLAEVAKYIAMRLNDAHARDEQQRVEAALLRSEATTRALLNAIPDLIVRIDRAGVFLDFTAPQNKERFTLPAKQIGLSVDQTLPEPLARQLLRYTALALDSGEMQIFEYQLPLPNGAGSGEYEARVVPSGADEVMAIVRDITERKRLESQFLQIQKIESVGQLAGGIAHDFNNLLTAIIGYADLAMMSLPAGSSALGDVEEIHRAAGRAAGLTRQLLSFARRQVMELRAVKLNDLIFDLYKLLRRLIGEDIELIMLPSATSDWVKVDPGQIEQVLVNLAVNGRDAMPQGGKLTLSTANRRFNAETARRYVGACEGEYVVLNISDTGIGMDENVRAHIFEPFFTTKEKGRGTGLGLATCYGIIKQHGGLIEVDSRLGQGTRIDIYLPRVGAEEGSAHLYYDDAKGLPHGSETILLVEDEPAVRMLAARVLRAQGYIVIESENGDEALSIARQRGHSPLDLLLTDVVMPRMSGKTLAERLTAAMPEVKVLFTSGYTNDPILYQGAVDAGIAFLQKPFTPATLARKVREVLDT